MMAVNAAPNAPEAGPTGPDGGGVDFPAHGAGGSRALPSSNAAASDPIFQGQERVESASPKATLLFQFFLFPLLIVVASVGVFLLFGAIGGADKSPSEHLDDVISGGSNVQKQSVQQLAVALAEERRRVDDKTIPLEKAFFAEPAFRAKLVRAFEDSFNGNETPERQEALALCLAAVGAPETVGALEKHLVPDAPANVRRAIVEALGAIPGDRPVAALVAGLKDADDSLRNYAVQGLSRHRSDEVTAALKTALGDPSLPVQLTAASALALAGDPAGKDLVARLLDAEWVQKNVVDAPSGNAGEESGPELNASARFSAISNGLRAALALHTDDLKQKVVALAATDGDQEIRALAREVLSRWPNSR
jgi:hypothetical protein